MNCGIQAVEFKKVGEVIVPTKSWPQVFYVSAWRFNTNDYELRPLTVTGLVKGLGKNFVSMNYWRFLHLLRKAGFLTTGEGQVMSLRDWRRAFWKKLESKKPESQLAEWGL